jgi:hypothetical protein
MTMLDFSNKRNGNKSISSYKLIKSIYFEGSKGPCVLQEGLVDAQASSCRHATEDNDKK